MILLLFAGVDDLGPFQKQATLIKAYRRKVVAIVRIYSGLSEPWAWGQSPHQFLTRMKAKHSVSKALDYSSHPWIFRVSYGPEFYT